MPKTGRNKISLKKLISRSGTLPTRWFTAEYASWFGYTLPALDCLGLPIPLGGTSNHLRVEFLQKIGGWDSYNVTEDCELGMRIYRIDRKSTRLNSSHG